MEIQNSFGSHTCPLRHEGNIALLVEQAMERMMEHEQFSIGWEET